MSNNIEHVERRNTDFGFMLIVPAEDGWYLEAYGMTGVGRYELFYSLACSDNDNIDDILNEMEAAAEVELAVCRKTKAALAVYKEGS